MTKQQILQRIAPADIYLHYLALSKFPVGNISSPFSDDKKPSFKLYKNGSFKCFSTGRQGDVWQFVADLKNLDCKKDFTQVLKTIETDLNLINGNVPLSVSRGVRGEASLEPVGFGKDGIAEGRMRSGEATQTIVSQVPPLHKERGSGGEAKSFPFGEGGRGPDGAAFSIETTDLTPLHYNYFEQYGVSSEILNAYGVRGVKKFQFWQESKQAIKKFPIYDGVIAFAYEVNGRYEIYIPEQELPSPACTEHSRSGEGSGVRLVSKFFYNALTADDIFGLQQAADATKVSPSGRLEGLIIAAGKKDCLVLNAHGYNAVSFRSENHFPTEQQIKMLLSKCHPEPAEGSLSILNSPLSSIYICYDNDYTNPKNPGQAAQQKIIDRYPFITPVYLPEGFKDVAELYYKGGNIDQSFEEAQENIEALERQSEIDTVAKRTIFHIAEEYLSAHYKIRYNSIKLELQILPIGNASVGELNRTRPGASWKKINENSLFIEMQKKGINISIDKLVAILKSDYTSEYNPVTTYFNTLAAYMPAHPSSTGGGQVGGGEPDYISKLASFINCKEPAQFLHHFKKWLARTVKCATVPEYFNKQALIFVSPKQNDGKSTFCRFLCPPALSDYIAEDITNDKDARILLCRNFLINLDELAVLSKQEINSLKAFFSKTQINERLPYDRTNSIIPRIASFIGSTNQDEFLSDETGSVRWLCFAIDGINWNYKKEIDINRVWAQALYLANDPTFEPELTRDDIAENEQRNRDFQILSIERELINKAFQVPHYSDGECSRIRDAIFMTSTEIMQHLMATEIIPARGLNKIAIGRAMKQEGFERDKHNGVYGYHVIPLKHSGLKTSG